jgi:hypothetical protein
MPAANPFKEPRPPIANVSPIGITQAYQQILNTEKDFIDEQGAYQWQPISGTNDLT